MPEEQRKSDQGSEQSSSQQKPTAKGHQPETILNGHQQVPGAGIIMRHHAILYISFLILATLLCIECASVPFTVRSRKKSPDLQREATIMERKNREAYVIIDSMEQSHYDGVLYDGVVFSPDSKHYAYGVENDGKSFVVLDQIEQKHYDRVLWGPYFSSDSRHIAYVARVGNEGYKEFLVIDKSEGKRFDEIRDWESISLSPKFDHHFFIAGGQGQQFVVFDDQAHEKYSHIQSNPIINKDWSKIAYTADNFFIGGKFIYLIVDGIEISKYFNAQQPSEDPLSWPRADTTIYSYAFSDLAFGPDGKHLAYTLTETQTWYAVEAVDQSSYPQTLPMPPTVDSRGILRQRTTTRWGQIPSHRKYDLIRKSIMIDRRNPLWTSDYNESVTAPAFSADGKQISFKVKQRGVWSDMSLPVEK